MITVIAWQKLKSFVTDYMSLYVFICGDFNANLLAESRLGKELTRFCNHVGLKILDKVSFKPRRYTYLREAHNNVSWLDYLIITNNNGHVQNVSVDNSFITYDHFPLVFTINMEKYDC